MTNRVFEMQSVTSVWAAFVAGLVTGVHCAGMCGPIGCAVFSLGKTHSRPMLALTFGTYHVGRLLSYASIGALAGALGSRVTLALGAPVAQIVPWMMLLLILAAVFRWDRWLPKSGLFGGWYLELSRRAGRLPKPLLGGALGLATPLLPCGPLYLLFAVCLFADSAAIGALYAGAFALGTIPLLLAMHASWFRLQQRLSPKWLRSFQLSLALVACTLIAWRSLNVEAAIAGLCHTLGL